MYETDEVINAARDGEYFFDPNDLIDDYDQDNRAVQYPDPVVQAEIALAAADAGQERIVNQALVELHGNEGAHLRDVSYSQVSEEAFASLDNSLGREPTPAIELARLAMVDQSFYDIHWDDDDAVSPFSEKVRLVDRETLLGAMDHIASTTDGALKENAMTSLASKGSNETLKQATQRASGRSDDETLQILNSVVNIRAWEMKQREDERELEISGRTRGNDFSR